MVWVLVLCDLMTANALSVRLGVSVAVAHAACDGQVAETSDRLDEPRPQWNIVEYCGWELAG